MAKHQTSFMMQLEEKLKGKGGLIVKFSPWRHDDQESLWAAFALEFMRQLSESLPWWKSIIARIKLFWERFNWREGWIEVTKVSAIWLVYVLAIVGIIIIVWGENLPYVRSVVLKAFMSIAVVAGFISRAMKKLGDCIGSPLKFDLKKYVETPDYTAQVCFIERFHEDFKKMIDVYAMKKQVYVFVDDLDRCTVPKAANLMQTINLMISDNPQAVFIMAMDREKVAAGLAVKDKELIRYLRPVMNGQNNDKYEGSDWIAGLRYGYTFIEKFIQLPFGIPRPTNSDIDNMMERMRSEEKKKISTPIIDSKAIKDKDVLIDKQENEIREDEQSEEERKTIERKQLELKIADDSEQIGEIVHMVSSSLDFNPRRIKQLINLFRLRAYIAYETQLLILPEEVGIVNGVTLEQLGKIVAISLRWPLLLQALAQDENLLKELSEFAEGGGDHTSLKKDVARYYSQDNQLMELIRFGCEKGKAEPNEWTKHTLSRAKIDNILQVSPRTRSVEVAKLEVMVSDTIQISDDEMAEVKTSKKDSDIIREAIAKQLIKRRENLNDEDYENLETLNLSTSEISSLVIVSRCTSLQRLYLSDTQVKDIEPLRDLTNLQRLYLSNTQVIDIEPLKGLINLQRLDLGGTLVVNLEPIKGLFNLQELNLWNSHVIDLGPIKRLDNLRELDIRGTQVIDLEPLKHLTGLRTLYLGNKQPINLESLNSLTRLQRLDLKEAQVSDGQVEKLSRNA